MTAATKKALTESIAHWRRLTTGKRKRNESIGIVDCALCAMFRPYSKHCDGCPVYVSTNSRCGRSTPYSNASEAQSIYGLDSPEFKTAARAELNFLRSLLPKVRKAKSS